MMLLELLSQPFDEKGEDKPVHATEQTVKVCGTAGGLGWGGVHLTR